jgi:predicted MFS family arabinose efflux permease
MGLSGAAIALQSHVLVVAPGRTDIASAWYSASFNVGIAGGPLMGGLVLSTLGLRCTPLVGGMLALLGLAAVVVESRLSRGSPSR